MRRASTVKPHPFLYFCKKASERVSVFANDRVAKRRSWGRSKVGVVGRMIVRYKGVKTPDWMPSQIPMKKSAPREDEGESTLFETK